MPAGEPTVGRHWWLLVSGFATSNVINSLLGITAVVTVVQQNGSPSNVSAVSAARMLPLVVLSAAVVMVAHLPQPRLVLLASGAVRCILAMVLAQLSAQDRPAIMLVVAITAVAAVAGAPYKAASGALIGHSVPERRLGWASAAFHSVEHMSFLLAPALCGGLLLLADPPAAFRIAAALSALLAIAPLGLVRPPRADFHGRRRLFRVLDGARLVLAVRDARVLLVVRTGARLSFGVLAVVIALLPGRLDLPAAELGFFHAALGAGALLGLAVLRKRVGSVPTVPALAAALVVLATAIAGVGLATSRSLVIGLLVVAGAADLALHLVCSITLQRTLPPATAAGAGAAADSLTAGGLLVGSLAAPGLVAGGRLDVAAYWAAGALGLLLIVVLPNLRSVTRRTDARRLRSLDRIAALAAVAALQDASAETIERLAEAGEQVHIRRGLLVIGEGETADAVFVLLAGRLAVHVSGTDASRTGRMPTLLPGALFGEIGVLRGRLRSASVLAVEDSVLLRLPAAAFIAALSEDSGAGDSISQQVEQSLSRSHS